MSEPIPPFDVRAIAAYQARNNTEVSLQVGHVYRVQQTDGKGLWWQTKTEQGTYGWFPASYTEIIPSTPPTTETPQLAYQAPAQQVYTQTAQPASQPAQAAVQVAQPAVSQQVTSISSSGSSQELGNPPEPSGPPKKEEDPDPKVFVKLQVIEARGLRGDAAKTNPAAFIFRRNIGSSNKEEKMSGLQIHATKQIKKTVQPRWNEMFHLSSNDAENEILYIRVSSDKKFKAKGKDFLGEVSIPLRSAVRDFDQPKFKFKWLPISGDNCTGEVLIFVQFIDNREGHGPKDFKHESHVGWTKEGGFDINNIPPEWKKIFKQVGIRRADLEQNPELAGQVLDIMQKANLETPVAEPVAPQPPAVQAYQQPQPQQQQYAGYSTAPAPTPQVVATPAPPPPPPAPGATATPAPRPPPAPTPAAPAPPPLPAQTDGGAHSSGGDDGGGGMSDLQRALLEKKQKGLRKVDPLENKPPPPASEGNALNNALLAALNAHRKDIEGNDKDDDWGDDWN